MSHALVAIHGFLLINCNSCVGVVDWCKFVGGTEWGIFMFAGELFLVYLMFPWTAKII